jgi:hypothetical protein
MKFTNGIWFDREHTQIYNAVEVSDVTHPRGNEIKVLCTTRHIRDRGDTLNKPTITLSSPASNIIACTATHFRGVADRTPPTEFFPDVKPDAAESPSLHLDGAKMSIVAGDLMAELEHYAIGIQYTVQVGKGQKGATLLNGQGHSLCANGAAIDRWRICQGATQNRASVLTRR